MNNFSKISHLPSELGALCALAGVNSPVRVFQLNGKFAHAAKTLKDSNIKAVGAGLKPARLQLQRRKYYESKR
jgi:hypothetical protein